MFFDKFIENTMINGLRSGNPEVVRRLQAVGYTPFWSIGQLVDQEGEPVEMVDSDLPLPPNTRMERHSVWHWSHRAAVATGAEAWWPLLERKLASKGDAAPAQVLASHVADALLASALSGETVAVTYTWDRALRQKLPLWERRIMLNQLFNVMEKQGNRLGPLLQAMHREKQLTAKDWSLAQRRTYASDPVFFLFKNRSWDALDVVLTEGAAPQLLSGETLVSQVLQQVTTQDAIDPGLTHLLGTLLVKQAEALPPDQVSALNAVVKRLEKEGAAPAIAELAGHLLASARVQATQTLAPPVTSTRRRQRS